MATVLICVMLVPLLIALADLITVRNPDEAE